jgi:hypothetical protein
MFIGHYSAALAAKAVDKTIPLGVLFAAAQFMEILDLYYMPFTHSLSAAVFWAVVAACLYKLLMPGKVLWRSAMFVGSVVASHWLMDFIVHKPDLPLIGDAYKVGLGLWDYRFVSLALEVVLLLAGAWVYMRASAATRPAGRWAIVALCGFMIAMQIGNLFGPPPPSITVLAFSGVLIHVLFACTAWWLDRFRH